MNNPYTEYYSNQAGNCIPGFSGTRFQRGHGFFGRIFSGILPVLKYLGRKALLTGINVAQDALHSDNFKDSLKISMKRNAADTVGNIAEDFASRAKRYAQTGTGFKRRRRRQRRSRKNSNFSQKQKRYQIPRKRLRKRKPKKHNKRQLTPLF